VHSTARESPTCATTRRPPPTDATSAHEPESFSLAMNICIYIYIYDYLYLYIYIRWVLPVHSTARESPTCATNRRPPPTSATSAQEPESFSLAMNSSSVRRNASRSAGSTVPAKKGAARSSILCTANGGAGYIEKRKNLGLCNYLYISLYI